MLVIFCHATATYIVDVHVDDFRVFHSIIRAVHRLGPLFFWERSECLTLNRIFVSLEGNSDNDVVGSLIHCGGGRDKYSGSLKAKPALLHGRNKMAFGSSHPFASYGREVVQTVCIWTYYRPLTTQERLNLGQAGANPTLRHSGGRGKLLG